MEAKGLPEEPRRKEIMPQLRSHYAEVNKMGGILQVEPVEFSVGLGTGIGVGEREKSRMTPRFLP